MIKNIVFDFGGVAVDWNPHYLYDSYFGSAEKTDWFLQNVCTYEWNTTQDGGRPFAMAIDEKVAQFPEWEMEINMFFDRWEEMIGGEIPGMADYAQELKSRGYKLYGLSNWSAETIDKVLHHRFFSYLDGMVVSGVVRMLKPNADIYRHLLSKYGLEAEESVFIDDTQKNVDGAIAVGMKGIRFENAAALREKLEALLK